MGNDIADASTRTNQAETRTGEAIYENEGSWGSDVLSIKEAGSQVP